MNIPRLNENEKKIMSRLNKVGFDCPIRLQIMLGSTENVVQNCLDTLWKVGLICRPTRGLAVSLEWAEKNPQQKERIETLLGVIIA